MAAAVQIPAEVYAAVEYQMRTAGSGSVNSTHFPIFENPRTAVAVVDVSAHLARHVYYMRIYSGDAAQLVLCSRVRARCDRLPARGQGSRRLSPRSH